MTKDEILAEIRRTATENGGAALGRARFEQVTGIGEYDWGRHWARFSDAVHEAGFEPNVLQAAYGEEYLIERFISLMREIGKVPTTGELRVKRTNDPEFPSHKTFARLGGMSVLIHRALEYSRGQDGYDDIVELCEVATASGSFVR